jgi:hypothetical protein
MRRLAGALVVLAAVGCGEQELSRGDNAAVSRVDGDISYYCLHRLFPEVIPTGVDRIIAIHREDPDAIHESGESRRTMREVLEDAARNLRRNNCDPKLAARIERELQAG